MKCWICSGNNAYIRECELEVAAISGKAHVDCFDDDGDYSHGCYKHIRADEFEMYRMTVLAKHSLLPKNMVN